MLGPRHNAVKLLCVADALLLEDLRQRCKALGCPSNVSGEGGGGAGVQTSLCALCCA